MRRRHPSDEDGAIAVDQHIVLMEHDVGKGGEPEMVDAIDLGAAFLDAAERADDRAVFGVRRRERARIARGPCRLATLDQRHDLLTRHARILRPGRPAVKAGSGQRAAPREAGSGKPEAGTGYSARSARVGSTVSARRAGT